MIKHAANAIKAWRWFFSDPVDMVLSYNIID